MSTQDMPPLYPIRAVSKITGVAVDTLRAWERRYRAVTPDRSARGRLYSDEDVQRLLLIQGVLERGHAIGQVAALPDADLQKLLRSSLPSGRAHWPHGATDSALPELQPLLSAIESFDFARTNEELNRLALLLSPAGLVHKVMLPVLRLMGDNWENGTFPIAQEHLFSACLRNLLGSLVHMHRPANGTGQLLFTTPANEQHEFGILAAALLAISQDFPVVYLGPNLPGREIVSAAASCEPLAVVLGIMQMNVTPAVRDDVRTIAAGLPAEIELWLGGTGAADAAAGVVRTGALCIENLNDFELHLARLKAKHTRQVAL